MGAGQPLLRVLLALIVGEHRECVIVTATGPVANDLCLVGSLVRASGPFCVALEGIVAAEAYHLFGPICLGGDNDGIW